MSETLFPPDRSPVALAIEDAIAGLAAMLGSAKAGRVFIPLDLAFPETYLTDTIADSGASLILADREGLPLANRIIAIGPGDRMSLLFSCNWGTAADA